MSCHLLVLLFGQSPQSAQSFIRRSHSTSNFQLWACIIEMWFPLAGGLSTCPTTTNCFSDHIESAENCEEKGEKPSNLYQTNLWSNNTGLLLRRRKSDTFLLHLTQHLNFCFYSEQNRFGVRFLDGCCHTASELEEVITAFSVICSFRINSKEAKGQNRLTIIGFWRNDEDAGWLNKS